MSPRYPPKPPWDFECPYQHSCPHLEGLSTQWVWKEYQRSDQEHLEQWKHRDILEDELHFKAGRKTPDPQAPVTPRSKPGEANPPKKRGAPKGHPGWHRRKPDHVDKQVDVPAPKHCPHCGGSQLSPLDEISEHLQEDIVLQPRTFVTNFKHHQAFCPHCERAVLQPAQGELLNCEIGPVTKAAAVFLRYGMRLSYRKVREFFDVFFDMPFVPASAMNFDRTATVKGEPLYEDLKQKLQNSAVAYADETYWREDGQNAFVWYGGNEEVAIFHIDPSRSAEVATEILSEQFDGSLVTDGYAAYNAVNATRRQSCLAHLIRKAKEISQEIELLPQKRQDRSALRFCASIANAFSRACKTGANPAHPKRSDPQMDRITQRYYSLIDTICSTPLAYQKAEKFRQRILDPKREYQRLFTFLNVPGLAPTNNHAEQALRTPVIFRKICFGTRSADGSRSHSVLPSLLVTAQRQGQHPLDFFQTLFTADTASAQAALFNDSS